eukprot:30721-Pelagococcus_subviridis.AAC.14
MTNGATASRLAASRTTLRMDLEFRTVAAASSAPAAAAAATTPDTAANAHAPGVSITIPAFRATPPTPVVPDVIEAAAPTDAATSMHALVATASANDAGGGAGGNGCGGIGGDRGIPTKTAPCSAHVMANATHATASLRFLDAPPSSPPNRHFMDPEIATAATAQSAGNATHASHAASVHRARPWTRSRSSATRTTSQTRAARLPGGNLTGLHGDSLMNSSA